MPINLSCSTFASTGVYPAREQTLIRQLSFTFYEHMAWNCLPSAMQNNDLLLNKSGSRWKLSFQTVMDTIITIVMLCDVGATSKCSDLLTYKTNFMNT